MFVWVLIMNSNSSTWIELKFLQNLLPASKMFFIDIKSRMKGGNKKLNIFKDIQVQYQIKEHGLPIEKKIASAILSL